MRQYCFAHTSPHLYCPRQVVLGGSCKHSIICVESVIIEVLILPLDVFIRMRLNYNCS